MLALSLYRSGGSSLLPAMGGQQDQPAAAAPRVAREPEAAQDRSDCTSTVRALATDVGHAALVNLISFGVGRGLVAPALEKALLGHGYDAHQARYLADVCAGLLGGLLNGLGHVGLRRIEVRCAWSRMEATHHPMAYKGLVRPAVAIGLSLLMFTAAGGQAAGNLVLAGAGMASSALRGAVAPFVGLLTRLKPVPRPVEPASRAEQWAECLLRAMGGMAAGQLNALARDRMPDMTRAGIAATAWYVYSMSVLGLVTASIKGQAQSDPAPLPSPLPMHQPAAAAITIHLRAPGNVTLAAEPAAAR